MADKRSFSTTCDSSLAEALAAVRKAELARETLWWGPALRAVQVIPDPVARRDARGVLEAERARRRERGECLASRDALLRDCLRVVLAERGWDRRYRPVPEGRASVPGRRPGVTRDSGRTGDGKGRVACNLPHRLWEQVRRAAYWESRGRVVVTTGDILRAAAERAVANHAPVPPSLAAVEVPGENSSGG